MRTCKRDYKAEIKVQISHRNLHGELEDVLSQVDALDLNSAGFSDGGGASEPSDRRLGLGAALAFHGDQAAVGVWNDFGLFDE
jgi:hypothetical protein